MCVAELNLSTLSCQHRWYRLVRPCGPTTNLVNCNGKLGLDGWEIKSDFCPFCDAWNVDTASFKLIGQDRSNSNGSLHRKASQSLSISRRESRSSSLSQTDSDRSMVSLNQVVHSEKNRSFNARLDQYLSRPTQIPTSLDSRPSDVTEEDGEGLDSRSVTETGSQDSGSVKPVESMARPMAIVGKTKSWGKSKKFGKMFSFAR